MFGGAGDRVVTTDELTGIQALERKHPGGPLAAGKVERREFKYILHGTCTGILSRDVVTGQILAPTLGLPHTEADFLGHVQGVVATDPQVRQGHFVLDNLNIHQSEALVRWVAAESDLDMHLGEKGKHGMLQSRASRAAFLRDPTHRCANCSKRIRRSL